MAYKNSSLIPMTQDSLRDFSPKINSNGDIVWEKENGDGVSDIFLYKAQINAILQLTNSSQYNSDSQINDDGEVAWWANGNIFFYDGNSISNLGNGWRPQMSNHNYITWTGDNNVYLYDGTSVRQLTENFYNVDGGGGPRVNDYGLVVWSGIESRVGGDDNNAAVPEPSTMFLLGFGLMGFATRTAIWQKIS